MEKRNIVAHALLFIILLFSTGKSMAQKDSTRLKQEVEVVKAYQPNINEAVKINDIPKIKSEQTETPTFDYSIYSKPVFSTFEVTPVAAAKMVGAEQPDMGLGLLKIGAGNYLSPYGEFFFNSKPSKTTNFGMHFKHLSSSGKVKLLNTDLVKAPESENAAEIFGKKFFRSSSLSGSIAYDRKAFNYYGYTGNMLSDQEKEIMIPYYQDKQYFSKGSGYIRLKSETKSDYDPDYDLSIKYHFLRSKTGQSESEVVFAGNLAKMFGDTYGNLFVSTINSLSDSIWNQATNSYGFRKQTFVKINPAVKWAGDIAFFQIGLNSTLVSDPDESAAFHVWPQIKAEWSPVEQYLTLFVGLDGYLQQNTYSAIATENPYVDPYHDLKNANFKNIFSGGFKGKLGTKTNYVAQAAYSMVKDQHFYFIESQNKSNVLASNRRLNNTFSWMYDDVNILKLSGEILHSVSDNFSVHLLGNYYTYDLKTLTKAYQMPDFDLTFSANYKPSDLLKFTADIFVTGKRTALIRDYELPVPTITNPNPVSLSFIEDQIIMDPIIDLNVGAEYQFSKSLSFFAKLNNFGFQKYEQWLGYTSKSLNGMVGLSYSF